ncbi:hypothetical protein DKX38_029899 [Salix brachista]|uniref:Uncharacterized protein n=1 Tax=Salix brachista TaxID=2182728 RepID=A0A5N5J0T3_9ROSI|nr:hypothetical protein DKX38_029899 [Salix brachista]
MDNNNSRSEFPDCSVPTRPESSGGLLPFAFLLVYVQKQEEILDVFWQSLKDSGNLILNLFRQCDHEQMKNAEGCIVEIIGENNVDHFFVVPYHDMDDMNITLHNCFYFQIDWHGIENFQSWLKVMLNSDGEIENMDEETHAERHARTVALAQANGRLRFKPVSKSVNASSKDCSKMVIPHASNDNKTQAAIARLEALENDYIGMETVEVVDDDEASLEDDVYIQKKQKDTKRKTRQVKALENSRKAPRNFLELLYEQWDLQALLAVGSSALFVSSFPIIHVRSVECVFVQSDARRYMMIPLA